LRPAGTPAAKIAYPGNGLKEGTYPQVQVPAQGLPFWQSKVFFMISFP